MLFHISHELLDLVLTERNVRLVPTANHVALRSTGALFPESCFNVILSGTGHADDAGGSDEAATTTTCGKTGGRRCSDESDCWVFVVTSRCGESWGCTRCTFFLINACLLYCAFFGCLLEVTLGHDLRLTSSLKLLQLPCTIGVARQDK